MSDPISEAYRAFSREWKIDGFLVDEKHIQNIDYKKYKSK